MWKTPYYFEWVLHLSMMSNTGNLNRETDNETKIIDLMELMILKQFKNLSFFFYFNLSS